MIRLGFAPPQLNSLGNRKNKSEMTPYTKKSPKQKIVNICKSVFINNKQSKWQNGDYCNCKERKYKDLSSLLL